MSHIITNYSKFRPLVIFVHQNTFLDSTYQNQNWTLLKTIDDTLNSLINTNGKFLFFFVCISTFLLLLMKKNFIESEMAAFEVLESQGHGGAISLMNSLQYFSIPFIYFWKFTIISFMLWLGCFTFGFKIDYGTLWKVSMVSELIFFVPELLKIFYFIFLYPDPNLFEVRAYYPLSLMTLFDFQTIPSAWHYPLKALNIFEVVYCLLLIRGLQITIRKNPIHIRWLAISFYVIPFILWLGYYVIVYK